MAKRKSCRIETMGPEVAYVYRSPGRKLVGQTNRVRRGEWSARRSDAGRRFLFGSKKAAIKFLCKVK